MASSTFAARLRARPGQSKLFAGVTFLLLSVADPVLRPAVVFPVRGKVSNTTTTYLAPKSLGTQTQRSNVAEESSMITMTITIFFLMNINDDENDKDGGNIDHTDNDDDNDDNGGDDNDYDDDNINDNDNDNITDNEGKRRWR